MRIITNESRIKRNAIIGRAASIVGLAILAAGMYITFAMPEQIWLAWGALLIGFLLSQIGIYFGNRWGRRPRPDEQLNDALKGLGDNYSIYHYSSPVSHLLIGPAGILILSPRHQFGTIVYEKGKWKQKGGSILQRYLRVFAQEGLGRPDLEISSDIDSLNRYLRKNIQEVEIPSAEAALIFTNERAEITVDDPPIPTIPAKKLKDFIRKKSKEKILSPENVTVIRDVLEN